MKKIMMAAAALCCITMMMITTTSCTDKNDQHAQNWDPSTLAINLDTISFVPYIHFGTSLSEVQGYMADNFADYSDTNPDSLFYFEPEGGALWVKLYKKGPREVSFYFTDAEGKDLTMVSYDFYFPIQIEAVMNELERNGFTNRGEIRFEDDNSDISYLFLSPDESIEAMIFYWEKDGGSWALTFQPTNDFDLQHLVKK